MESPPKSPAQRDAEEAKAIQDQVAKRILENLKPGLFGVKRFAAILLVVVCLPVAILFANSESIGMGMSRFHPSSVALLGLIVAAILWFTAGDPE